MTPPELRSEIVLQRKLVPLNDFRRRRFPETPSEYRREMFGNFRRATRGLPDSPLPQLIVNSLHDHSARHSKGTNGE